MIPKSFLKKPLEIVNKQESTDVEPVITIKDQICHDNIFGIKSLKIIHQSMSVIIVYPNLFGH